MSLSAKIFQDVKAELYIFSFIIIYILSAVAIHSVTYGSLSHQLLYAHEQLFLIFIPASIAAIYYHIILGAIRNEPILIPILRWLRATFLGICLVFFWPSFTSYKILIPNLIPFYFDQYLIKIDRLLHFGNDPWRIVHNYGIFSNSTVFDFVYFTLWSSLTFGTLMFIVFLENNIQRKIRYILLYVFTWIILGNILAILFSSVGPIYLQRLTGDTSFSALASALLATGYEGSIFFYVQNALWDNYVAGSQHLGLGISAFPSVHVGVACVVALYLAERSRWLIAPGCGFVFAIQAGAIFSGWHYAVDGYVSMIIVYLMHSLLHRWSQSVGPDTRHSSDYGRSSALRSRPERSSIRN